MSRKRERSTVATARNGARGRDGKFLRGNCFAAGHMVNREAALRRAELFRAVSASDIRKIGKKLVGLAVGGDIAAAKVLLDHVVGKPPDLDGAALTSRDVAVLLTSLADLAKQYVAPGRLPDFAAGLRRIQE